MIAIKNVIPATLISSHDHPECISIRLELPNPVTLCCVYIPPNPNMTAIANIISYLTNLLDSYPHSTTVIVGDFNLPDIDWDTLSSSIPVSELFCDFVFNNNLLQLINTPTHTRGNILDLLLTTSEDLIQNIRVISQHNLIQSDHFIINFCLTYSTPPHSTSSANNTYVYDFPKADFDGLCSFLFDVDFDSCLQSQDVEFVWLVIKEMIYAAMDLFIPKVRLRNYQYPCWYTPELRHLSKCMRTLHRRLAKHPTVRLLDKVSQMEQLFHSRSLVAKTSYESLLIQSFAGRFNSKIYNYIKGLTNNSSIPPTVRFGSLLATSDQDRANAFNSFFHSVFTDSSYTLPPSDRFPSSSMTSFISDLQISQLDVLEALNSLDVTKSTGPDGIGPKLLKQCALALYIPIHHLICISISKQAIPSEWKCHSITPVYKSGDKALVNNYRPISLLCIISKVLEQFVFDHLNIFLNENIVLSPHQFGFRKNHSVTHQLLLFLSNVHESLNHYSSCDVIYLDFKKAFDTVPHNELLLKLWKTGITGNTWNWLKEYLTGRRQHVNINGCFSSALPVISGVPQGSILGPLLFLIYINDLPSCTTYVNLFLFADDTKCLKSITTPVDTTLLQSDLDSLSEWSLEWKLSFNELKCLHSSLKTTKLGPATLTVPRYIPGNTRNTLLTIRLFLPVPHAKILVY